MHKVLLTEPDQKERLSLVYVKALAARAGFTTSEPDLDRDSIDLSIHAGGPHRPALDLQLKATTKLGPEQNGCRSFPSLSIKNYDDLRCPTQTPRLLMVLELPQEVSNKKTVTVRIPVGNLLNVEVLQTLMERSRKGEGF